MQRSTRHRLLVAVVCLPLSRLCAQSSTDAQRLRAAGDSAIVHRDWKALASLYGPVTQAEHDNGMAWFRLGAALHELGRFKDAAAAMREAVRLQFQPAQAELRLARALARDGALDSVAPHLERAATGVPVELITTDPDFDPVHKNAAYMALIERLEAARYPCRSQAEAHQFDFWIGDWIVTAWNAPNTVAIARPSENHITAELEHCLIKEHWLPATGGHGESINFWDPNRRAWRQIWMDQNQWSLDYEGEYKDGAMRFHGWTLGPTGERRLEKLTFFKIAADTVRQLFEQSVDSGKTWRTTFDGRYVRMKKG